MEKNTKLYQKIAAQFKKDIKNNRYTVGSMLPAERIISEQMKVSRTVVREAMIMLEVEGYVEVRKGAGIKVVNPKPLTQTIEGKASIEDWGPFELLQARQLFESSIAEFAATQATKQDLVALMKIQDQARVDDYSRDSYWDREFHIQLARCTQNSVVVHIAELLCNHRENNPYWKKLHEHIDEEKIRSWCNDHDAILKALMKGDAKDAKQQSWMHIEKTRKMLFDASTEDYDRFLYSGSTQIKY
ncbi:GntR family transcriptional regulator [Photobacterium damselae]|uniref:GntR family transcriptional regulator n=1 Tax=Photobacterium damselae TaxID=38293 RepID=UPI001EFEEF39|nr:GntR family transcriptional regulator [Photobacterium damselae]MCG9780621.1 GntR family transcriptional regulator [Photobacterium damselae]